MERKSASKKTERILVLTRSSDVRNQLAAELVAARVDSLMIIGNSEEIAFASLDNEFDILAIDKSFRGNARETAGLIRRVRETFSGPIIGFQTHYGNGDLFVIQVAGCNFALTVASNESDDLGLQELCNTIFRIGGELAEVRTRI